LWDVIGKGGISMDRKIAPQETNPAALGESYRQMAAEIDQEMQAEEWAEALIGDAFGIAQEPAQLLGPE
jgi:hypothetical protein